MCSLLLLRSIVLSPSRQRMQMMDSERLRLSEVRICFAFIYRIPFFHAVATLFTMVQELTEVKRELTRMDKVTAACMSNARAGSFHGMTHCLTWRAVQVVYGKSRATTNGGMSWRMLAPSCSVLARAAVL